MTALIVYTGDLRTECTHLRSGSVIETDAPVDNKGKGERFSPTDLVATALASCMATTMGIAANNHEIEMEGAKFETEKIMAADPRRISEIKVNIIMPSGKDYNDKQKAILERAALTCPVYISLHPDLKKTVSFSWG